MEQYLDIIFSELPVTKTFEFLGEEYSLAFLYNQRFDFITCEIYKDDEFLASGKLVYGRGIFPDLEIPALIPLTENDLDIDGFSDVIVNSETFGSSVQIYFEDGEQI